MRRKINRSLSYFSFAKLSISNFQFRILNISNILHFLSFQILFLESSFLSQKFSFLEDVQEYPFYLGKIIFRECGNFCKFQFRYDSEDRQREASGMTDYIPLLIQDRHCPFNIQRISRTPRETQKPS